MPPNTQISKNYPSDEIMMNQNPSEKIHEQFCHNSIEKYLKIQVIKIFELNFSPKKFFFLLKNFLIDFFRQIF